MFQKKLPSQPSNHEATNALSQSPFHPPYRNLIFRGLSYMAVAPTLQVIGQIIIFTSASSIHYNIQDTVHYTLEVYPTEWPNIKKKFAKTFFKHLATTVSLWTSLPKGPSALSVSWFLEVHLCKKATQETLSYMYKTEDFLLSLTRDWRESCTVPRYVALSSLGAVTGEVNSDN